MRCSRSISCVVGVLLLSGCSGSEEEGDRLKKASTADDPTAQQCPEGEHVCGGFFCCADDDYGITVQPPAGLWSSIQRVVDAYQRETPAEVTDQLAALADADLRDPVSFTFPQEVLIDDASAPRSMAVEVTVGLIDVPYEVFTQRLPAADWGVNLSGYLGGGVTVEERDGRGFPVRQVERMVLNPIPCDSLAIQALNMDMTKAEIIEYAPASAKVYWQVYASDNNSTEADVGSVEFRARGERTLVTFHSAHRLHDLLGLDIPNVVTRTALSFFFTRYVQHYGDVVQR